MSKRLTTEAFVCKAKEVHGETYDYSLVEYVSRDSKVTIICKVHGVFEQIPGNHLSGKGCRKCSTIKGSIKRNLGTGEFIKRALKVHGNTYDYSMVQYIAVKVPVKVKCMQHGLFEQIPGNHLQGNGCPMCGISKTRVMSTEEFIDKARIVHNTTYDYSQTEYKYSHTELKILCNTHGLFYQTPTTHLKGSGCPKCAVDKSTLPLKDFITRAGYVHNNLYDYSQVKTGNNRSKANIGCRVHGLFLQRVNTHLNGGGCPKCAVDKSMLPLKDFITRARYVHNNLYDYSQVKTGNTSSKASIGCRIHGLFLQRLDTHLNGGGCPKCANGKRVSVLAGTMPDKGNTWKVYFLKFIGYNDTFLKIGITHRTIGKRFSPVAYKDFKVESIFIVKDLSIEDALSLEKAMLDTYESYKYILPKAMIFPGKTELLRHDAKLINKIIKDLENYEQFVRTTYIL
jgi:hypothetical protein